MIDNYKKHPYRDGSNMELKYDKKDHSFKVIPKRYKGDDNLRFIVELQKQSNGRITTERLGEFIDMNGELTKLADEIDECNKEYKEALRRKDHVRANELKKKRDELVKKYHEKLNNYAKELYKESQKRKTKATIATHKYLMNKLNKL